MSDSTTNYLDNLNKRISISSTEIGNIELKESFVLNSRRTAADLSSIGAYLNDVIVKSYSTLCSRPKYPEDVIYNGLSGSTIVTWLESSGNHKLNSPVFWFPSTNVDADGRPCTIKESIQYIWENLNDRIVEVRENPADLAPLYDALNCHETMIERLKTDTFGAAFILNCSETFQKQKWPISKHIFEVLTQLTIGHQIADLNGLNSGNDPVYPNLDWNIALNDLLDVDVESTSPNGGDGLVYNAESDTWVPGSISDVEWLSELEDVDTTTTAPVEGDILVWNGTHTDNTNSNVGAWVPQALIGGALGQKLGGFTVESTIEDVYDMESIRNEWAVKNNLTYPIDVNEVNALANAAELWLELTAMNAARYRPGTMFQFGGNEKWYSGLAGNISNLNIVSLIPEIWVKDSTHLSFLSSAEKNILIEGGLKAIPFVFLNKMDFILKERREATFASIIYNQNLTDTGGITGLDAQLSQYYSQFNQTILSGLFNLLPSNSEDLLRVEIIKPEKTHPLGITACSLIYDVPFQSSTLKALHYDTKNMLGVSRSDIAAAAVVDLFTSNQSNELTGEINSSGIGGILARVAAGIGTEAQHSGYSRVMILGPYRTGDKIYICPAHILEIAEINYPYGICISETFMSRPLRNVIDPNGRFASSAPNYLSTLVDANGSSNNYSMYEMLGEIISAEASLTSYITIHTTNLKNTILDSPVGFIVKDDSPRLNYNIQVIESGFVEVPAIMNSTGNTANTICKNLLGSNIASGSNYSKIHTKMLSHAGSLLNESNLTINDFTTNEIKVLFEGDHLHLPTIKIQL